MASFAAQKDDLFSSGPSRGGARAPAQSTPSGEAKRSTYTPTTRTISPELKAQKVKEARQHAEDGMKYIRKTLFHRTPDHLAAAPFFEKSAQAYAGAEEPINAKLMWIQAAESQIEVSAFAAAANDFKKAAKLAGDLGESLECSQLYSRCADCWRHYGQPDKAAEYLLLGATSLVETDAEAAVAQTMAAVDVVLPADASAQDVASVPPQALDHLKAGLSLLLRLDRHQQAQEVASRLITLCSVQDYGPSLCFAMAVVTVLQLTRGDVVQADVTFREHLGSSVYLQSKECKVMESLIIAYKERDADALEEAQNHHDVTYLDREVIRLIKQLALTVARKKKQQQVAAVGGDVRAEQAIGEVTHDLDELLTGLDIEEDLAADNNDDDDINIDTATSNSVPVAQTVAARHVEEDDDDDDDDEIDLS